MIAGRRQLNVAENTPGFDKAELIAAFAFSLMPLWVEILCSVVAGFYLPRHAMLVVFGFSLLLLPVLWLAGTPHRAVLLTLIGAVLSFSLPNKPSWPRDSSSLPFPWS